MKKLNIKFRFQIKMEQRIKEKSNPSLGVVRSLTNTQNKNTNTQNINTNTQNKNYNSENRTILKGGQFQRCNHLNSPQPSLLSHRKQQTLLLQVLPCFPFASFFSFLVSHFSSISCLRLFTCYLPSCTCGLF